MRKAGWDKTMQKAYLAAVLHGELGTREDLLDPGLFLPDLRQIVEEIADFRRRYGGWPEVAAISSLFSSEADVAKEIRAITRPMREWGGREGRDLIRKEAMRCFILEAAEYAEHGPEAWAQIETAMRKAQETASPSPPAFAYGAQIPERHKPRKSNTGLWRAPTGLPTLDRAMKGGLGAGEVGLVMAPTKRGKSHMMTWFGTQALLKGFPVLHITLELRDEALARRYDRCLTGMDDWDIQENLDGLEEKLLSVLPDPTMLRIISAPRFYLTVGDIGAMLKDAMDEWGRRPLLIVDYGSILKPSTEGKRHEQVGAVHEELSTLAMSQTVPLWSPYQTNRSAFQAEEGALNMGHAGDSYASMQHVDIVLTMDQSPADKMKKRMILNMAGVRDGAEAREVVRPDWARSRVEVVGG